MTASERGQFAGGPRAAGESIGNSELSDSAYDLAKPKSSDHVRHLSRDRSVYLRHATSREHFHSFRLIRTLSSFFSRAGIRFPTTGETLHHREWS